MKETARRLRGILKVVESELAGISEQEAAAKPSEDEWSKKQIIGHLIDSAANNHQRFVRAVYNAADTFPTYEQMKWVEIQQYNQIPWTTLTNFWVAYNQHLSHVIDCIPEAAASAPCNIGKSEPASLHYIVVDYLRHLRHHLKDIVGEV